MNVLNPQEWLNNEYELLIDARSPSEFKHSHIIGAKNFYTLDDNQHSEVGTIYKHNKLDAKVIGARYACINIASSLDDIHSLIRPYSKIGIYCARGGQRSESFGIVLSQIGYNVFKLKGGYKEYRNYILSCFDKDFSVFDLKLLSLCGNTGVGKSRLLANFQNSIDLESMAKHYGSVFGVVAGTQPNQKYFDDLLFNKILNLKKQNAKTVFIEAESRKIGKIILGASMYEYMSKAFKIWCECSMELRILRCVDDYKNINEQTFNNCLLRLKPYISNDVMCYLKKQFDLKNYNDVARVLLKDYYDKVYKKPENIDYKINLDDIEKATADLKQLEASLLKQKSQTSDI